MRPRPAGYSRPVSEENVETVRAIFAAWEQGDFSSADWADPEIEFTIPGLDQHVERGIEAMRRAWAEWLRSFSEFGVEGRRYYDAGDKVVVDQVFRGKGRGSGVPIDEIPGAAVLTVRDGRVTRFEGHTSLEDALASAGIQEG